MRAALLTLALGCLLSADASDAATYRVDDSASQTQGGPFRMKWVNSGAGSRRMGSELEGQLIVLVRLDTSPFLNRSGRIYVALDDVGIGPVKASWTSRGRLQAGEVREGQRTLVYAGPIRERTLEDHWILTIQTDGDRYSGQRQLNFRFDIDLD